MNSIIVVGSPDILKNGFSPYLLFFDKISVPDIYYLMAKLEFDSLFRSMLKNPPKEESSAGKYLNFHYSDIPTNTDAVPIAENLLYQLDKLHQNDLLDISYLKRRERSHLLDSPGILVGAMKEYNELDEYRIKAALQLEKSSDVFLGRGQTKSIQYLDVPSGISHFDAIQVTLKSISMPRKDIPLDELLSFKEDSSVKHSLLGFRSWIYAAARSSENRSELHARFTDEYNSYKRELKRLGEQERNFELSIVASLVRDILDLNLGSAIETLFSYRTRKVELDSKADALPGRRLDYINKLESVFNDVNGH